MKQLFLVLVFAILAFGCNAPISTLYVPPSDNVIRGPVMRLQPVVVKATEPSQTVYHLDPSRSMASYRVGELVFGSMERRDVVGVTPNVQGDLMLDWAQPNQSRLGTITVDASTLESGSKLRDQRVRNAYLAADRFPNITFVPDHDVVLFPPSLTEGETVRFLLPGQLEARDIAQSVVWNVTLTATADEVMGSAELEVAMSDFAVGPISIAGLIETENWLHLQIEFVASVDQIDKADNYVEPPIVAVAPQEGVPEFFADISPILSTHCVACHQAGRLGHAIFPLETAQDAVSLAADLAFVTQVGNMPPWPASDRSPSFEHERKLSQEDKALIDKWAAAGAPSLGDLSTPLVASTAPFVPIRRDVVVRTPSYLPKTETPDDWRCFLFDPNLGQARMMTGYHIVPSNLLVAHHITSSVYRRGDIADAVAKLEAQDDMPGWECLGGPSINVDSSLLASSYAYAVMPTWTPGMRSYHYPAGTGVALDEDTIFVVQVHLNTEGDDGLIETALHLQLAPAGEMLRTITGFDLYAPVEIPCPKSINSTACLREAALANPTADPGWSDILLQACDKTIEDYAGQSAENVVSDCDYEIAIDGDLLVAYGHMHEIGRRFKLELNPDTPDAQIILDIDHWDFNWQDHYWLRSPLSVRAGDKVRITCTWDNSPLIGGSASLAPFKDSRAKLRSMQVDQLVSWLSGAQTAFAHDAIDDSNYSYILWGEGTHDEMCVGSLGFLPDSEFEDVIPGNSLIDTNGLLQRIARRDVRAIAGVLIGSVAGIMLVTGGGALTYLRRSA